MNGGFNLVYRTTKDIQQKKDEKRKLILNAAAKVFSEKGYHLTSVKDIVDEAEISVGSFYFYFKNKEHIFETLYDEAIIMLSDVIQKIIDDVTLNIFKKVSKAIFLILHQCQSNIALAKIMLITSVGLNSAFEEKRWLYNKKLLDMIEDNMKKSIEEGVIYYPNVKVAALAYGGAVLSIITDFLHENTNLELVDYTYPITVFVMQGGKMEFDNEELQNYIKELKQEIKRGVDISV